MIRKVVIRGFKRFEDLEFTLPDHVVLAGPNNTGKTTLLQAISAWALAFEHWRQRGDLNKHNRAYARAPLARQAFSAVPLRSFDLLWHDRVHQRPIEIEVQFEQSNPTWRWTIAMEFVRESTEQIYVRPRSDADPEAVRNANLDAVFAPAMTGLVTAEPVYQPAKIQQLLGMARPGEVLRNLLADAHTGQNDAWTRLQQSIQNLFGYELLPPNTGGADIVAEYRMNPQGPAFDIASAGSGFQQVLMLLTFLNTRPASVLLIDEPDAHLHVLLQDAIYHELRANAARQNSQLIIATHSEILINAVDTSELFVMLNQPRALGDQDRNRLRDALRVLNNTEITLAQSAPGVLYTEDYTDLDILRAWAKTLEHPIYPYLIKDILWQRTVIQTREGARGVSFQDHYEALSLVRDDLPGVVLLDGDARREIQPTEITGHGLQRLRWRRYEIESYLVHPATMARYVQKIVGVDGSELHLADLQRHFEENYPPAFMRDPHQDIPYLSQTKARRDLIPPALGAAGLHGIPYTRYHEIAALMTREEIHPEVLEKLDTIQRALNL